MGDVETGTGRELSSEDPGGDASPYDDGPFGWLDALVDELASTDDGLELAASIRNLWVSPVLQQSPNWKLHYERVLEGAKRIGLPWLELAAHDFALKVRVGRDGEGASALDDAYAALERASEPDCAGCPQRACVAHSLVATLTAADRVGYLEERLEAIEGTLAHLDPEISCFSCFHRQKAEALHDLGQFEQALGVLDGIDSFQPTGDDYPGWHHSIRPETLIGLGRCEEALAWMVEADVHDDDQEDATWFYRQVLKAYALGRLGRLEEAGAVIPRLADLTGGDYLWWARTVELLVDGGLWVNDWQLGAAFGRVTDDLLAKGNGAAFEIAELACRRAIARGSRWASEKSYARVLDAQELFRDGGRVDPIVEDLRARLDAMSAEQVALPVPADRLLEHLAENRDPENELDLLFLGRATDPDDDLIAVQLAHALLAMDEVETAREVLGDALTQKPESALRAGELFGLLQVHGSAEDREALAARLEEAQPAMAAWIRATVAFDRSEFAEAMALARGLMERDDEAFNAWRMAARCALRLGDAVESLRLVNDLIERQESMGLDVTSDLWDSLSAATLCGEWGVVRDRAPLLGMDLIEGEGPIEEEWNVVRVAYPERDQEGDAIVCSAVRTGPVTARVISVAPPPFPVKTNDVVVFDAAPLNPRPADADDAEPWTPVFPVVGLLRIGWMSSWIVDGAAPSDDEWSLFRDHLRAEGWGVWSLSPDDYRVVDPAVEGGELPGVFAAVAVPLGITPAEANELLRDLTATWPHSLSWLALAEAAGVDESELARHRTITATYDL
jgi:tetratricopeptide (TPR) repeat protein